MNPLLSFLEKFKKLKDPRVLKEKISLIIQKSVGISIAPEEIILKNGVLSIKADPIIKNEIFLKKENIIQALEKELVGEKIINVR